MGIDYHGARVVLAGLIEDFRALNRDSYIGLNQVVADIAAVAGTMSDRCAPSPWVVELLDGDIKNSPVLVSEDISKDFTDYHGIQQSLRNTQGWRNGFTLEMFKKEFQTFGDILGIYRAQKGMSVWDGIKKYAAPWLRKTVKCPVIKQYRDVPLWRDDKRWCDVSVNGMHGGVVNTKYIPEVYTPEMILRQVDYKNMPRSVLVNNGNGVVNEVPLKTVINSDGEITITPIWTQ